MWIPLRSDAPLAAEVRNIVAASGRPTPVSVVGGLSGTLRGRGSAPSPFELPATPLDLLLAAGRATAAVGPTPLARFNTVGWWAVQRWYWTVDAAPAGRVGLTNESDQVRNHHRWAFSEALGLGLALLLAEYLLAAGRRSVPVGVAPAGLGIPVVVDIDSLGLGTGTRPDLWVLDGPPNSVGGPASILLEAKGRSTKRTIHNALAKGVGQVCAISGSARRIVAGVEVPRRELTAFAIEVPASRRRGSTRKGRPPSRGGTSPSGGTTPPFPSPRSMDDPERDQPYESPEARGELGDLASDAVRSADAARLRAFAGLDEPLLARRSRVRLSADAAVDATGVTFRVAGDHGSAEVFVGLLSEVAEAVMSDGRSDPDYDLARTQAREIRRAIRGDDPEAAIRTSMADDGCILSVRPR